MSALEVVRMLEALDPSIEVNNLGESDFIIAYKPPKASEVCWQWIKTVFVCLVSFFGAAFAIMTFNNDVNVGEMCIRDSSKSNPKCTYFHERSAKQEGNCLCSI